MCNSVHRMYVYLLWDHGRQSMLAWNSILLPEHQQFDVGVEESDDDLPTFPTVAVAVTASAKKRVRRGATEDDGLLAHSLDLLAKIHKSAPTTNSTTILSTGPPPAPHVATTEQLSNLSTQADLLMVRLESLEKSAGLQGLKPLLMKSLESIIKQMCKLTSDGHDSLVDQDTD
jgi:hypothetical protein